MVLKLILFVVLVSVNSYALTLSDAQLHMLTPVESRTAVSNKNDVIVYFWATWCPDCKSKLTNEFKNAELYKKFDIYLVSTDKSIEKVTHFKNKNEIASSVYMDLTKDLQKQLNVFSVPTIAKFKRTSTGLELVETQSGGDISRFIK
jgi:thiol-disulfide isomerase/thioredoxin